MYADFPAGADDLMRQPETQELLARNLTDHTQAYLEAKMRDTLYDDCGSHVVRILGLVLLWQVVDWSVDSPVTHGTRYARGARTPTT